MSGELDRLKSCKESLLLSEVAAWLHDWKKGSDEHIRAQSSAKPTGAEGLPHTHLNGLLTNSHGATILTETVPLIDLIKQGEKGPIINSGVSWLIRALRRCHDSAHVEKELELHDETGKQHHADTRLSSPFGYEGSQPVTDLTKRLNALPYERILDRSQFHKEVSTSFSHALGDTRRPVNEVTLWDWSGTVAALYKAALAGCVLNQLSSMPNVADLRWRLLSIRVDGPGFIERIARISDMLARRNLLQDALNQVRKLLEETYPLGTEVYRDENGSVFVVPDIKQLLDYSDQDNKPLAQLIRDRFAAGDVISGNEQRVGGEIVPELILDPQPWVGDWPKFYQTRYNLPKPSCRDVPPISERIEATPSSPADATQIRSWWSTTGDICPVCGIRPQGPSEKAKRRKVCDICEARRADRSKKWTQDRTTTIWIDEVADVNGRVALITCRFGIDEWLKPDGMVRMLCVTPPNNGRPGAFKNPSFARLRRVWETTQAFWRDIGETLNDSVGQVSPRLHIRATYNPMSTESLVPSHVYEIKMGKVRLSLVCIQNGDRCELLTSDNLRRLARVLDAPDEFQKDHCAAAMYVRDQLQHKSFSIEEPTGYGSPNKHLGTLAVTNVVPEAIAYTPAIRLLEEPRTFMALVPADKALPVAHAIKRKYETEMGKVRNRLPMSVGLVFAGVRTPLPAILDAGRRMLTLPLAGEWWTLHADAAPCGSGCLITFTNGLTWNVPIKMGDRTTDDNWYPYFIVNGVPRDQSKACPWKDGRYLVHASCLRKGEEVFVTPSRFDFEYLDTAAQRFEVSYESNGERRGLVQRNRPYFLEELCDFDEIWTLLKDSLTTTQIRQLEGLIEAKRSEWGSAQDQPTFSVFVRDVLTSAEWTQGPPAQLGRVCDAAVQGQLSDILELYMKILKEKPERGEAEEEATP